MNVAVSQKIHISALRMPPLYRSATTWHESVRQALPGRPAFCGPLEVLQPRTQRAVQRGFQRLGLGRGVIALPRLRGSDENSPRVISDEELLGGRAFFA
jgi:hypothetical protein